MAAANMPKAQKNAFRGLDGGWGARLEASFDCGSLVYMRGEAARAYPQDMKLRQFTREALFLDGDAMILRDTISADTPHDYQWLLQTDAPPEAEGDGCFAISSGATRCRLQVLRPADFNHHLRA